MDKAQIAATKTIEANAESDQTSVKAQELHYDAMRAHFRAQIDAEDRGDADAAAHHLAEGKKHTHAAMGLNRSGGFSPGEMVIAAGHCAARCGCARPGCPSANP